jgi:hypothetical protein
MAHEHHPSVLCSSDLLAQNKVHKSNDIITCRGNVLGSSSPKTVVGVDASPSFGSEVGNEGPVDSRRIRSIRGNPGTTV